MPLRNHALRRNQEIAFIRLKDCDSLPEVMAVSAVDFTDPDNLFGPFPSKSRARATMLSLAADNGLCWHVLSTKKSDRPCFAYQLQKCSGYCVAHESLSQHNMRLMTALTAIKFRSWPCAGPVAIKETHHEHGWEQVHVFDQWHYLGSANSDAELNDLLYARGTPTFDADIYKLLVRYFDKGGRYTPIMLSSATEIVDAING
jgi:DNA polymerase III subunit epsilon